MSKKNATTDTVITFTIQADQLIPTVKALTLMNLSFSQLDTTLPTEQRTGFAGLLNDLTERALEIKQ